MALALDPTLKGDELAAIVVSSVYRGSAIPLAWHILPANRKGAWMEPAVELLRLLSEAMPSDMEVAVLCDRGLRSPLLWDAICELGWHPYVRQTENTVFRADLGEIEYVEQPEDALFRPEGGKLRRAADLVKGPGRAWIGSGTAFRRRKRKATMIVYWDEGQERPWLVMTDHPPEEASPCLYSLRFWIELGFRAIKREGWQWQRTRRTDPDRVARHWLAMAVATLLSLGVGTRVEDARELGKAPSNLRKPPEARSPDRRGGASGRGRRKESVMRLGIAHLRRRMERGGALWKRLWLLPEAWPEPPPTVRVIYGASA